MAFLDKSSRKGCAAARGTGGASAGRMKWMGRGHSKQQPRPAAAKWERGSILIITQSARANHGESCRKMEI